MTATPHPIAPIPGEAYTAPRVTLADGAPAHTRRTPRMRQPAKPSVRFIGDPVEDVRERLPVWLYVVGLAALCIGTGFALRLALIVAGVGS